MSSDKFAWMLRTGSLFFCRSDKFADPLEGHFTKVNPYIEDLWVAHQRDGGFGVSGASEEELRRGYRMMLSVVHKDKTSTFVNCWHMNEVESPGMWASFAAAHECVCIRSSFDRLHRLLPDQCFVGGVRYIDYDRDFIDPLNSLNFVGHKDIRYREEREIRAVVWGSDAASKFGAIADVGIGVPIDLASLITAVHTSPSADDRYEQTVAALCRSHGLDVVVERSRVRPT
jgi:hypothetical protein